ncbi:MAG: hypothetical protein JW891_14225 [Candidatus Lokiarchaeota archaeon]|nr:hypothetical protein [Candidatus Lokiarchaeota archaeon]
MEDLFIINEGGQLIFSWHPKDKINNLQNNDDLISGFLSALNSFATLERGEDIKSLKLKETSIIFEKNENHFQKLTFVITTKDESLIEICHSIIHDLMDQFTQIHKERLSKKFDGQIDAYFPFLKQVEKTIYDHGLDALKKSNDEIKKDGILKSFILLEPKSGQVFYLNAKQFVSKEKLSFLAPLITNSARLLYKNNLEENIHWILLTTARNEILLIETRQKLLILKQYQLIESIEEDLLSLEFFNTKDIYVKKPKKIVKIFEDLIWDPKIKQIYLVDLVGKVLYSKIIDNTYDCKDYIPETISFLTASKKTSEQIYSRPLFNSSIGGEKHLTTICVNFNNIALILIGKVLELSDFNAIQKICKEIVIQLK